MDLLHFDSPTQAVNYFILCFTSILGIIQLSAARTNRHKYLWLEVRASALLGATLIATSFAWFFTTEEGIFIPGLAGGEMIALFMSAFLIAVPTSHLVAVLLARLRSSFPLARASRVKEPTL
jgi:hypothetical protein